MDPVHLVYGQSNRYQCQIARYCIMHKSYGFNADLMNINVVRLVSIGGNYRLRCYVQRLTVVMFFEYVCVNFTFLGHDSLLLVWWMCVCVLHVRVCVCMCAYKCVFKCADRLQQQSCKALIHVRLPGRHINNSYVAESWITGLLRIKMICISKLFIYRLVIKSSPILL